MKSSIFWNQIKTPPQGARGVEELARATVYLTELRVESRIRRVADSWLLTSDLGLHFLERWLFVSQSVV